MEKWWERGWGRGDGKIAASAHGRDVGCGGLWRNVVEENGEQTGRKMGRNIQFSQSLCPIYPEVEDLPLWFLCKNQLTALTDGKMGIFATHRYSSPQWLARMLALVAVRRFLKHDACHGILSVGVAIT